MADAEDSHNNGATSSASAGDFAQLPIEILVSVGKAKAQVGSLLGLSNDSVLVLDQKVDDPVELYVGTKLIGRGELQELEGEDAGQLVVRLTEVTSQDKNP